MINPEISKLKFYVPTPPLRLVQYLPKIWPNSHYVSYTDAQMEDLHNDILHVKINSCTLNICSKTTAGEEHILSTYTIPCIQYSWVCVIWSQLGVSVYRHTPTQNTSNTTYHCYVVLEVYRHTQHKIPPTRHTIVMSCWRFTDIHNTKYLQHDIPLLCRVGGLPTYTTQNTSNTTYHCYVVLEVYRHTQHKIPPTRHTIGVSCM